MNKFYRCLAAALLVLTLADAHAADPPLVTVAYTKHYGTTLDDQLTGIAHDTLGNAVVVGNRVDPTASVYRANGFVRKYDALGTLLWHRGKVSASTDGVTTDKNGNTYIVGSYTAGTWPHERDYIYLQSFDTTGTALWKKQFTIPVAIDRTRLTANAIATDPQGNNAIIILFEKAYYPYQSRQVFVQKYDLSGQLLWEKQVSDISSPYAARPSLTVDTNGNITIAVHSVAFQKWNIDLIRLHTQGSLTWSTRFFPIPTGSTQLTYVHALAADQGGNLYLTGITRANLSGVNKGSYDVFLRKYNPLGGVLWTRQFGTSNADYGNSLTVDLTGNIYVAGSSMGNLSATNRGSYDAFIRKYNAAGQLLRGRQFSTSKFDIANAVRVDQNNAVYIGGNTYGNLSGTAQGNLDIYLRKYELFQ